MKGGHIIVIVMASASSTAVVRPVVGSSNVVVEVHTSNTKVEVKVDW